MTSAAPRLRAYRSGADDAALARIAQACTGMPCTSLYISYELSTPGLDPQRDVVVGEDEQGTIIGYASVTIDGSGSLWEGRVICHIDREHQTRDLAARAMLLWSARRMQEQSETDDRRVMLFERIPDADEWRREFLETAGFAAVRFYQIMRFDEPQRIAVLPLPEPFRYLHGPGRDGGAEFVAMFNDTWVDHYGFVPLTIDGYLHDLDADPDYNPHLDIVIVDPDRRFVGFAFCRIETRPEKVGEVVAIGIRRGFRGQGLGRILLLYCMKTLRDLGVDAIELTVDSDNPTGAVQLYDSVGFRVVSGSRRYRLEHDDVMRLATLNAC